MTEIPSIHFRRRGFYALWVALLLLSGVALVLWRKPVYMGTWNVQIKMRVDAAPGELQARIWFGPTSALRQKPLSQAWERRTDSIPMGQKVHIKDLHVPLARRRWTQLPYPEGNGEVLVIELRHGAEPPRYLAFQLEEDLKVVLMRHKRVTTLEFVTNWQRLPLDPSL